jgi:hypothetical protein
MLEIAKEVLTVKTLFTNILPHRPGRKPYLKIFCLTVPDGNPIQKYFVSPSRTETLFTNFLPRRPERKNMPMLWNGIIYF